MIYLVLWRIFSHEYIVSCHKESLIKSKPCYLLWGILLNSARDHFLSAERNGCVCFFPVRSNLPAAHAESITVLGDFWIPWVVATQWPLPGSNCKEFPATGIHLLYPAIAFIFCFSPFIIFWFVWSTPLVLWHVSPSVHADGAIQRSKKFWCP